VEVSPFIERIVVEPLMRWMRRYTSTCTSVLWHFST